MTEVREHTFPFTGTETAQGLTVEEPPAGGGRNRTVLLVAVVVGALVLATAAYFLFLSGGSSSDTSGGLPAPVSKPKVSTPAKAPAKAVKPAAPAGTKSYDKAVGRDPFKPLVVSNPSAGTGSTGTTPVTTGGSTTTGTTPVTSGGTTTTGGTPTTTGGTTAGPTAPTPVTVRLLGVSANDTSARLTVASKSYAVAVGDVFATYFKVLRLTDGRCGTFQYGDSSFDLCEGQTTRLQ